MSEPAAVAVASTPVPRTNRGTIDLPAMAKLVYSCFDAETAAEAARQHPFLRLVPKNTDFTGEYHPVRIKGSNGDSLLLRVHRKCYFAAGRISGESLISWRFDQMLPPVVEAYHYVADEASRQLFGDGSGILGRIRSVSSNGWIRLKDPLDVRHLHVGDGLNAIGPRATVRARMLNAMGLGARLARETKPIIPPPARGSHSYLATQFPYRPHVSVTAIDIKRGAFQVDVLPEGIDRWLPGDDLVVVGNYQQAMEGLSAWLPAQDPAPGDCFLGADRSRDPVRFAGHRIRCGGFTIHEALAEGYRAVSEAGGDPRHLLLGSESFAALVREGDVVPVEDGHVSVSVPGSDDELHTLECYRDTDCPAKTAFLLTLDSWTLRSIGDVPKLFMYGNDLSTLLRIYDQDAAEVRIGFRANLACHAPWKNARITLSA